MSSVEFRTPGPVSCVTRHSIHLASLLLAVSFLAGCRQPTTTDWLRQKPGLVAPDFTLPQLDAAEPVTLSSLRGRVVIMEFWATWCGPCRFSTPSLDQIYRRYKDRGVSVLLINEGEKSDTVRTWLAGRFAAPILLDTDVQVGRRYVVRGIPTLFVIDQEGFIAYVHQGYAGGLEQNLKLILLEMLSKAAKDRHG